jgi:hypothetical protein
MSDIVIRSVKRGRVNEETDVMDTHMSVIQLNGQQRSSNQVFFCNFPNCNKEYKRMASLEKHKAKHEQDNFRQIEPSQFQSFQVSPQLSLVPGQTVPQRNNSPGNSATNPAPAELRGMSGYEFTFQVQVPNDTQHVEHDDEEEVQLHREVLEVLPEEDEEEEPEPIERSSGSYPFKDVCTMILHSYLYGDDKVVSIKDTKKLLYTITLILDVYNKVENKENFKLPAVDNILNYHQRKSNRIPIFPTKVEKLNVKIDGNDAVTECGLNLPSKHLEMLLANKRMSDKISALPDHTPNCSDSLQNGYKWRTHRLFQQPVRTIKGIDYWVGDVVSDKNNDYMLIHSFVTVHGNPTIRYFKVELRAENSGVLHSELNSVE